MLFRRGSINPRASPAETTMRNSLCGVYLVLQFSHTRGRETSRSQHGNIFGGTLTRMHGNAKSTRTQPPRNKEFCCLRARLDFLLCKHKEQRQLLDASEDATLIINVFRFLLRVAPIVGTRPETLGSEIKSCAIAHSNCNWIIYLQHW